MTYMYLGPMTFGEFLVETAPDLCSYAQRAARGEAVPETAHERLTMSLRRYLLVGGMPEAVLAYSQSGLVAVSEVQRMILESYEDDFAKYAQGVDLALMQEIFLNLPPQACKKVKYVNFSREVGSLKSLRELVLARGFTSVVRFDMNQPSVQVVRIAKGDRETDYTLHSLPLYAAPFVGKSDIPPLGD